VEEGEQEGPVSAHHFRELSRSYGGGHAAETRVQRMAQIGLGLIVGIHYRIYESERKIE